MNNMENMPKDKVTITVERKILVWIDTQIQSFRFRNRSHAFEFAAAQLMKEEKE